MKAIPARFAALGLALVTGSGAADDNRFLIRSGPHQTALIELYSSEGCSSCPPAEKWLGSLTTHPGLWHDFVPVGFHVDYWDDLGWKDRFASKSGTERQRRYAASWVSQGLYTPCLVRNGIEAHGWSGLLDEKTGKSDAGVLELVLVSTNQSKFNFSFSFVPPAGAPVAADYEGTVAWLGHDLVTDVRRGENAGLKLRHQFIVLQSTALPLGKAGADGARIAAFTLAEPAEGREGRLSLAAWVSRRGQQTPLQSAGGWWPVAGNSHGKLTQSKPD